MTEKFFISERGQLVILQVEGENKRIVVCDPVEDVLSLSVSFKKETGRGGKPRLCKKCGRPRRGHPRGKCAKG